MHEAPATLGTVPVAVRYEYEPECSLGSEAYVFITEVGIGGHWISAEHFNADWLTENESDILRERGKTLRDAAAEAAWERQEERAMERGYP